MKKIIFVSMMIYLFNLPTFASVLIHEVLYDGIGSDSDDVFTELYGEAGTSLDGWTLRGVNGSNGSVYRNIDLTGAVIQTDGLLVLATSSALGNVLTERDFIANVDWQNGPDAVQLLDDLGQIVDSLQYGDAGIYNAGEGDVALDVSPGESLTRHGMILDTNNNFMDFTAGLATPGAGPIQADSSSAAVPEPQAYLLCGLGLLGLAVRKKFFQR